MARHGGLEQHGSHPLRAPTRPAETPGPLPSRTGRARETGVSKSGEGGLGEGRPGAALLSYWRACPEARGAGGGSGEQFRSHSLSCPKLLSLPLFFFPLSLCPPLLSVSSSPLLSSSLFLFFTSFFVALMPTMLRNTDEFELILGMRGGRG